MEKGIFIFISLPITNFSIPNCGLEKCLQPFSVLLTKYLRPGNA